MAAVPPPDSIIQMAQHAASAASSPPLTSTTYFFSLAGALAAVGKMDPLAVAGIALAAGTFIANQVWAWAKNRREARAAAVQLAIDELQLEELRRKVEATQPPPQD